MRDIIKEKKKNKEEDIVQMVMSILRYVWGTYLKAKHLKYVLDKFVAVS